ncbi:MAG TPA: bifunctional 3-(3-hydroxy-phenyl)propionate/3-hydroxycinnamic acid hydroxylase [Myxococcota bacterium]|nr:bifunctional 3-(3-hydroxy-phenyl)propionate/3-hydroxycinnamic acid hydroxylase [Myxococcota bacterium]
MTERCDVAIVGYGPTGQTLAILLAQRGWRVTVLERWPRPYPMPRAVHFDHEVARIFQAAGVADALRAITEPSWTNEWRNAAGETLLRFGQPGHTSLSGWPESSMVHQPDLEAALDRRARAVGNVTVHRGCEVYALEPGAERVRVCARDSSGDTRELEAAWVVGCDGAHSFVRRSMRVPVEDLGLELDWLVVDLITADPSPWSPVNWQLCDPRRPVMLSSGGPGRRRFEFMRLPREAPESMHDARTAWELVAPWGLAESNAILERHAVYTYRARWAETWRRGRLILAGEAAHLMPLFAAQGLGSCLRDVATLAWKLDLVLRGRASEALLDTYGQERIPHVRSLISLALSLGRMMCLTDPDEAAARDSQLTALVRAGERTPLPSPPVMGPGSVLPDDPCAGEMFPQGRVRRRAGRGAEGLFDDLVGRGWVLLGADGDPGRALARTERAAFASLGGVTAHVGPGAPFEDLDGRTTRFFERTGTRLVLVRPDFRVFGTGKGPAEAAGLVAALERELRSPTVVDDG